jgi:hypothetical protein
MLYCQRCRSIVEYLPAGKTWREASGAERAHSGGAAPLEPTGPSTPEAGAVSGDGGKHAPRQDDAAVYRAALGQSNRPAPAPAKTTRQSGRPSGLDCGTGVKRTKLVSTEIPEHIHLQFKVKIAMQSLQINAVLAALILAWTKDEIHIPALDKKKVEGVGL